MKDVKSKPDQKIEKPEPKKELTDAEKRWNAAWRNKDRSFLKAGHKLD